MLYERKSAKKIEEDMMVKSYAYDALIEYGITSLPVNFPDYRLKNILITSFQQYFYTRKRPARINIGKEDGAVMCLEAGENAHFILFFDGNLSKEAKRWVIAKLLYYVRCGFAEEHVGTYIVSGELPKAIEFAQYFTCPDIILESHNILSAEDIIKYCQIPFSTASRKARYFKNGHNRFCLPTLERLVQENFKQYIGPQS